MYLVGLIILLHDSGTFWLYGAVCLVGTIYTIFFVPETKGKTIEEIQQMFSSSPEERRKGAPVSKAQPWFPLCGGIWDPNVFYVFVLLQKYQRHGRAIS